MKEIGGSLTIDDMDSLLDLSGLETLERIGGDFIVRDNSGLLDFDGLVSLKEIGGSLRIENNTKLLTLTATAGPLYLGLIRAFNGLVEAGTLLHFSSNGAIPSFDFFRSLEKVDGVFEASGSHPTTSSAEPIGSRSALTPKGG